MIVYCRSDATIKPGGVRIGTSEIYRPLEGLAWIADGLATSYVKDDTEQIVLFVVLRGAADRPARLFGSGGETGEETWAKLGQRPNRAG